jgi:hypothetical protein
MAIKIQSTKDCHVDGINCVIYGASGVGKTVLCSTAPSPIILSSERGMLSLSGVDVPFIEVNNLQDIDDSYKLLKSNSEYQTICIDSLTEIAELLVTGFRKEVNDGRQAYMKLAEAVGGMIRNFRNIKGKNIVFIAKQRRIDDEESNSFSFEPYMPGRVLPFNLPYYVDEVLCMRINIKGKRYIQTNCDRKYIAKDRSGKLLPEEEPNLTAIFNKIIAPSKPGVK